MGDFFLFVVRKKGMFNGNSYIGLLYRFKLKNRYFIYSFI